MLEEFLRQELDASKSHYIESIVAYYNQKLRDPDCKEDDLFVLLVFAANSNLVKSKDKKFLITLAICFSIGIALMDDVIDNELTSVWKGIPRQEVLAIACHFLFVFPQKIIITSRNISPVTKILLFKLISEYYVTISSGEFLQVSHSKKYLKKLSLKNVTAVMALKTGGWNALIAAIAICYANKSTCDNLYIKFATELGILKQMGNDIYDIFKDKNSQDLLNGVLNFPISAYLLSQDDKKRNSFLKRLKSCQEAKSVTKELEEEIRSDDLLSYCMLVFAMQKLKTKNIIKQLALPNNLNARFIELLNT